MRTNASRYGRLPVSVHTHYAELYPPPHLSQLDSIESRDLAEWMREIPGSHVTIVVDIDPSHTVAYNKIREVVQVEVMESPWSTLVGPHDKTVVFYLQPDPVAMAGSRGPGGRGTISPLGMLTDTLTKAIVSCVLK